MTRVSRVWGGHGLSGLGRKFVNVSGAYAAAAHVFFSSRLIAEQPGDRCRVPGDAGHAGPPARHRAGSWTYTPSPGESPITLVTCPVPDESSRRTASPGLIRGLAREMDLSPRATMVPEELRSALLEEQFLGAASRLTLLAWPLVPSASGLSALCSSPGSPHAGASQEEGRVWHRRLVQSEGRLP
jgi:hypothetical protein